MILVEFIINAIRNIQPVIDERLAVNEMNGRGVKQKADWRGGQVRTIVTS